MELKSVLQNLPINLDTISDPGLRTTIEAFCNLVEDLAATNRALQEEIQKLRDELNRLKGEHSQTNHTSKSTDQNSNNSKDFSSETERQEGSQKKPRQPRSKNKDIQINRTFECKVDRASLPDDAEFKGYKSVIVQDLKIETDNIEFQKEVYYSPSQGKTYMGQVPTGYEGGFGPTIKAQVILMKYVGNMSESKILDYLRRLNIDISVGTISNLLTKKNETFHQEKADIVQAGLASSPIQQSDSTSAKVKGENHHTHVMGNSFYTAYFTTPHKDRLTVLKILNGDQELTYCLNAEAFSLLEQLKVARKHLKRLEPIQSAQVFSKAELEALLAERLPGLKEPAKLNIMEATALAAYHARTDWPVVKVLLADDARQYKELTEELALCWVHEGRHYKKLEPVTPVNAQKLADFRDRFWDYYRQLQAYKKNPSPQEADRLKTAFDTLFATQTGYQHLDDRIAKTREKKGALLLVLTYPELPLHNNDMELGAREQARKRDVSFHTMSNDGTKANDTFLTIVQTCKKLGVNAIDYLKDRISKKMELPALAQLINLKALA